MIQQKLSGMAHDTVTATGATGAGPESGVGADPAGQFTLVHNHGNYLLLKSGVTSSGKLTGSVSTGLRAHTSPGCPQFPSNQRHHPIKAPHLGHS